MKKAKIEMSPKKKIRKTFNSNWYPYIMVLPAMICVFLFAYMPMFGLVIAFQDFDIVDGILGSKFVGFDNFITIIKSPDLLKAVWNTLLYGAVIVFGGFPFPIILALMFNEVNNMHFKKISQTVVYLPYFLSWISVIGLIYAFLAKEGPVNQLLNIINPGREATNVLMDSKNFLPILFISHLWKNVGWSSVVFLAAIAGIDQALYESASVDGCGRLGKIFYVTLPCIKGTAIIVLVMSLGTIVNLNFEQVYGLQNSFIQADTEVIGTLVYREGIQNGKYSLATAFGLMQGIVNITMVLGANYISKKTCETSLW